MKKIIMMFLGLSTFSLMGGVEFNEKGNAIWVSDYPEDLPGTLKKVYKLDKMYKWNKVTYDKSTNTYTVNCSLWIGKNNGSETWFQIGTEDAPEETVIIRGNLQVKPIWLKSENPPTDWRKLINAPYKNRLTVGSESNPKIKGKIIIDNSEKKGYSIMVGGKSGTVENNVGGQLYMYNSEIAPLGPCLIGLVRKGSVPVYVGGNRGLVFKNCKIYGILSVFCKYMTSGVFESTVFDNCGVPMSGNYQEKINGCTFENCKKAINVGARRNLTIYDCTFRNNLINWILEWNRLVAVDCEIDSFDKGLYSRKGGKIKYPYFISKRHIIVKVVDKNSKPVENVQVQAVPDVKPLAPEYDVTDAITDKDGLTPGKSNKKALLLSEILVQQSDEPKVPKKQIYNYTIEVRKDGQIQKVADFKLKKSWDTLVITLK